MRKDGLKWHSAFSITAATQQANKCDSSILLQWLMWGSDIHLLQLFADTACDTFSDCWAWKIWSDRSPTPNSCFKWSANKIPPQHKWGWSRRLAKQQIKANFLHAVVLSGKIYVVLMSTHVRQARRLLCEFTPISLYVYVYLYKCKLWNSLEHVKSHNGLLQVLKMFAHAIFISPKYIFFHFRPAYRACSQRWKSLHMELY